MILKVGIKIAGFTTVRIECYNMFMAFSKGYTPWNKGRKVTSLETLNKMSVASSLRKHSVETKMKIAAANRRRKGEKRSVESRLQQSIRSRGIKHPLDCNHCKSLRGKKHSLSARRLMSKSARRGTKSNLWKGGASDKNKAIRESSKYKIWRESVFKRDNFTCVSCGDKKGGNLNADHIKPFALFPKNRFELSNGRTLCINCHKKTYSYGNTRLHKESRVCWLDGYTKASEKCEKDRYWSSCSGCKDGHPSWWMSLSRTPEWEAWAEYNTGKNMRYDIPEVEECGWMSVSHAKDWLKFVRTKYKPKKE